MSEQNKIFTTLNQPLGAKIYSLGGSSPVVHSTLAGVPLGTVGNTEDGEIGLKVIQIAARGGSVPGFEIPTYDQIVLDYYGSTNNLETVTYKLAGNTVAVLTLTYAAAGAADNDKLIGITKA